MGWFSRPDPNDRRPEWQRRMDDVRCNNDRNRGRSVEDLRREEQERIDRTNKELERQREIAERAAEAARQREQEFRRQQDLQRQIAAENARLAHLERARFEEQRQDALRRAQEDLRNRGR